jgi:cell wall-associated NlpC family hydrolase
MESLRDLIGKPYAIHGRGPDAYDCFGLAIEVCRRFGRKLDDSFYDEVSADTGKRLIDETKSALKAERIPGPEQGAIVEIFIAGSPRHIGVCLGDGTFIHATQKLGVRTSELSAWSKRIEGYYTWQQ